MSKVFIVGPKKSQHIQRWYKGWREFGSKPCYLFTLHGKGRDFDFHVDEYKFVLTGKKIDFLFSIPYFLYRWWRIKPDVTNFHYLTSYALLSFFIPKKNLILNVWGSDVNQPFNNKVGFLHKWVIKRVLNRFTWINAPAEHIKSKLVALGANPNNIEVFQYGIELSENLVPKITDKVIFVSNRNWQSVYRINAILLGFEQFVFNNPESKCELWLYGDGEPGRTFLKSFIKNTTREVKDRIVVKGYTEHGQMISEIMKAHVFISIPETDGTPLSLLEAMDLGLYPILSDIDANREWVCKENAELICDVEASKLSIAILNAYNKVNNIDYSFVDNNKEIVRVKGDIELNSRRFQSVIKKYLN